MNCLDNDIGVDARNLTYQDFPHQFVWHKDTKTWTKRWKGFSLGRMYFVPPTCGERFYLQTLLTTVRGPKSFTDLRSFNNEIYPTFKDACRVRGLLEDDGEWSLCLREASEVQSGGLLRHLFFSMLLFCHISNLKNLWLDFRDAICDDLFLSIPNPTIEHVRDYGLFLLNCLLGESGYTLEHFPNMPLSHENWTTLNDNFLISEQLMYDVHDELERFQQNMENVQAVPEQFHAYERIIQSITTGVGGAFFLSGAGGTGKTYLYQTICHHLRSEGKIVLCVASSGIAALLLPGGRTAHSTFHLPVENILPNSTCNISKEDKHVELLCSVHLIIWDEAPTQSRFTHEALDHMLRGICDNNSLPFAGKMIVLGGDFQQTLPVIPNGSPEDIINVSLPRSYLWKHIQVYTLRAYYNYIDIEPFSGPHSPYKHATMPINRRRAQFCELVTRRRPRYKHGLSWYRAFRPQHAGSGR